MEVWKERKVITLERRRQRKRRVDVERRREVLEHKLEKGQKRRLYDFDLFVATPPPLTTLIKR